MLVHFPIYCTPDASIGHVHALLEQLLVSLHSYFVQGNKHDALVTTNDERLHLAISAFRARSRHRFSLVYVTPQELTSCFRVRSEQLAHQPCVRYVLPKFYPIVKQLDKRIIHVDFDTLFLSRVDFAPLLGADIGLVNTSRLGKTGKWRPKPMQVEFFRMTRQRVHPICAWINSGVFGVQRNGFDLCRAELDWYFANQDRAIELGYEDEMLMNALAVREPTRVKVIEDLRCHFLAYYLDKQPDWRRTCGLLHFHSIKPSIVRWQGESIRYLCPPTNHGHIAEDFYLAALLWYRHLHSAARLLDFELPLQRAMPLAEVIKEQQRITVMLTRKLEVTAGSRIGVRHQ